MNRLSGGLIGTGGKKKRASFCPSPAVEKVFTPPTSDEKKNIHGNLCEYVPDDILVVAHDLTVYKSWRKQNDFAFVGYFNDKYEHLAKPKNKKSAMDVLHAARAVGLLRSLDAECLRAVVTKVFPKKQFPRLKSKTGESQLESFLEKVNKVLDDHVETTKKTQPNLVDHDSVFYPESRDDNENSRRQKEELDHTFSKHDKDNENNEVEA